MKYTLDEVIEQEIISYRPINPLQDTGFYAVNWYRDEEGTTLDFGCITISSGPFDENPSVVPAEEFKNVPQDGWMHNDDCTCDDCNPAATDEEE